MADSRSMSPQLRRVILDVAEHRAQRWVGSKTLVADVAVRVGSRWSSRTIAAAIYQLVNDGVFERQGPDARPQIRLALREGLALTDADPEVFDLPREGVTVEILNGGQGQPPDLDDLQAMEDPTSDWPEPPAPRGDWADGIGRTVAELVRARFTDEVAERRHLELELARAVEERDAAMRLAEEAEGARRELTGQLEVARAAQAQAEGALAALANDPSALARRLNDLLRA